MTAVLPDVDTLVRGVLAAGLDGAQVFNLWPDDWYARMPLVVARRTPGSAAIDPRFLDAATVDVQTCAADRAAASLLARQARRALWDACTAQFADDTAGGYLSSFQEISGPAELRTGNDAVVHTDVFRIQATYLVQARPAPSA